MLIYKFLNLSAKIKTREIIIFAEILSKQQYDKKYKLINFDIGNYVFLRLYKSYSISSTKNRKFFQQYTRPFKILKRVDKQIYRLNIFLYWRIYFIIFVAIFEPIFNFNIDFYYCSRPEKLSSVFVENNIKREKNFELKKIIDKQISAKRRVKYLVRWKKYNLEYNQ